MDLCVPAYLVSLIVADDLSTTIVDERTTNQAVLLVVAVHERPLLVHPRVCVHATPASDEQEHYKQKIITTHLAAVAKRQMSATRHTHTEIDQRWRNKPPY